MSHVLHLRPSSAGGAVALGIMSIRVHVLSCQYVSGEGGSHFSEFS
jgi:hypothetical protein